MIPIQTQQATQIQSNLSEYWARMEILLNEQVVLYLRLRLTDIVFFCKISIFLYFISRFTNNNLISSNQSAKTHWWQLN